jgi:hypothetical protein
MKTDISKRELFCMGLVFACISFLLCLNCIFYVHKIHKLEAERDNYKFLYELSE